MNVGHHSSGIFYRIAPALWLCFALAARAATLTVTSTADSGAGTLRAAIASANPGDTVNFSGTLSGQTIPLSSVELLVTKNLTIDASALPAGIVINGGHFLRAFEITNSANVNLFSITMTNCNATNLPSPASGGGLLVDAGAALTASNCTVIGCSNFVGFGGGIAAYGAVTLNHCTVFGNVGEFGGGIYGSSATMILNSCIVSANISRGSSGGGIECQNGPLALTNCTLSENFAIFGGGGIYMPAGGTLALNACTLSGNFVTNGSGGALTIGTVVGTIMNCTFSGNSANIGGGGIQNNGGLTLINCTLSGNSSTNGQGGGIENGSGLTLINCTVSGNSGSQGGGIYNGSSLTLTNTIVAGNTSHVIGFPDFGGSTGFSGTNNFTGGNPQLATLGNYGGPTQTMPPLPGSPVIDAGNDSVTNFLATDGRGVLRLSGAHVDIGAVEDQQSMVFNTNDSGAGSLRAAIAAAPDLVLFTNTLSGQAIHLTSGELLIVATNLGIDASALALPVLVDGGHAGRVLEISSGIVVLNSLVLTNGYLTGGSFPSESGAGILVDSGATLTANNCTLSGNNAVNAFGGAIVNEGTEVLNNCTFSGNGSEYGGGIFNYSGGLTLSNCIFSGNSATGYSGAFENEGTMVLYNCAFSGNSSVSGGGAIQNGGYLTLNNCTLSGNSTVGTGGAIQNNSNFALNNCTVSGNNAGAGQGGGIYNKGTTFLTNTIVAGNTAATSPDFFGTYFGVSNLVGGSPQLSALGSYGGPTPTMPPLVGSPVIDAGTDGVTNSLTTDERGYPRLVGTHADIGAAEFQSPLMVASNTDAGAGSLRALIARADAGGIITFSNAVGAIQLTNGELAVGKNLTMDASAHSARVSIVASPSTNARLLEITAGSVILKSMSLQNAHLSGFGFPTNAGAGALVDSGASLTASNCVFSGDSATNGGGIFNLGTLTLNNCSINNNSTSFGSGGGIFNSNVMTLSGCTFSADTGAHGAGICNSNGTATLNNCTLAGNQAFSGFGGGIENGGSLTLNNCTISQNNAEASTGSGIYNVPSVAVLVMTNTIVAGNAGTASADISGSYSGANNFVGSPPVLSGLGSYGGLTQTMPPGAGSPVIDAGTDAVTSFLSTDQRGLPRLAGAHVDIGAAEFTGNPVSTTVDSIPGSLRYAITYTGAGGVITFVSGLSGQTIQLTNGELLLAKNLTIDASGLGGGIGIDGGHASRVFEITNANVTLNSLTITNGFVTGSYPTGAGGGVLVDGGASLALNSSTLSGDSAAFGGGMLNQGTLTLNNCLFAGDTAGNGAGLYNLGGTAVINNSTFAGNSGSTGGGMENNGPLTLNNCTFAGNTGNGIYNFYSGTARFINCTVANNSGGGIDNDISAGPPGLTNTIVAGNGGSDILGSYSGTSNFISGNPRLASLGNWGGPTPTMPPMFGSPTIDAGLDSVSGFLSTDQRGYARLSGAHVDIGAVEAQVVPAGNAPVLSGTMSSNSFQLSFTSVAADFTAITSTNVALPRSNWTVLGNVSGISSGQYQFTDMAATNHRQFYDVVSP